LAGGGMWGDGSTETTKLILCPGGSARGGVVASGCGSTVLLLALLNRLPSRSLPQ